MNTQIDQNTSYPTTEADHDGLGPTPDVKEGEDPFLLHEALILQRDDVSTLISSQGKNNKKVCGIKMRF